MRLTLALAFVVLIAGCTSLSCKEPFKVIDGECCLDANSNRLCDKYEVAVLGADCQLPYINHLGACCLDTNGNRICDSEEAWENTTTESQPTSTVTTHKTATTSTTTSTTTTTSMTTTTFRHIAATTGSRCLDTDGGKNPSKSGMVYGIDRASPHGNITMADYCINNSTVMEYNCEGDWVLSDSLYCGIGRMCEGGRCCLPSASQCEASSDCCGGSCIRKRYISLCY